MKGIKKGLAILLVLCTLLSMVVMTGAGTADTAQDAPTAQSTNDNFYKIVHLDCGRKYFSPENIKKIIDNAAAAGFNQVELYLSDNQGFRFALDNMNITTTDNTYDLTPALGDGYSDGSKYPDGSGKYLSQSEMNDIIAYAKDNSIDIVPCINVPGHMGAILEEFTQFKYSGSNSSIDLENAEAVAFALAITDAYATYFQSQGVKFYNLGADEYANDMPTMGFQGLYTSGKYQKFVDFLNSAAQIVINHKMTPRAFNDGIYYNEDNTYSVNSAIQVCYWSCGWRGYNLASAQYLVNQGMDVINTHGDYYWVLGNSSWQCSADKASKFNYYSFQYRAGTTGNGNISDPAGAMFCIWCDVGNADGKDNGVAVVSATADTIAAFGATLPGSETVDPTPTPTPSETPDVTGETITVAVGSTTTTTISGANYAGSYTTEDPSIAIVEVTGKDATEATTTYTQASVTCNTLISSDSNNWTAVSGYYYKADDGNYYPLYAKRIYSWSWDSLSLTYTYTWGYSTTSSTSNVTQIGTQETTSTSATTNITVYTKEAVEAVPASTTVTFTGVAVGTTYVTVGNTKYTINVVAEDLSKVTPLTVEYWITNLKVTAGEANSTTISAQSVYGEAGVDLSTLVPATGSYKWGKVVYWKGTVLDANNHQTTASGVENDKTGAGKDFSKIRYYNGSWQYFYEADGTWNTISSTDQVVVYWLQPTEVTKEITTLVKDWGYSPDDQGNDGANKVALTVAVVYPDGTVSPAEGNMYSQSTTLFNYWDKRDIGLVAPINNSDYEISKITVTDGKRDQSGTGKWGANDTITWEKVTNEAGEQWYKETTYWTEANGGTPMVNGLTSGIIWSNYNTAKLVLIYLKPVHYDTNLTVNWVDDSANGARISTMEVAVSSDGAATTFYNGLKQTSALPTEGVGGTFTLDDNAYVTNSSNVNQTFNKNISTVPGVAEQYKSGLYQYVSAELSADGKTLTLHYNIDSSKLSKRYVVDFGLPVNVPLSDLVENADSVSSVTIVSGTATYDTTKKAIRYQPASVMSNTETVRVKVDYTNNSQTIAIGFTPATTVYYEEGFAVPHNDSVTGGSKGDTPQKTELAGKKTNVYGYDAAYASAVGDSNGTAMKLEAGKGAATFTFTGTGVDIYTSSTKETGSLMIRVVNGNGALVKVLSVNTVMKDGSTGATNGQAVTAYNVPVVSLSGLAHGTYTLQIAAVKSGSAGAKDVYLDGFRVYGTLDSAGNAYHDEGGVYYKDNEDNPTFIELRDRVLASLNATKDSSKQYADQIAGNTLSQVYATAGTTAGVVITSKPGTYTDSNLTDLLDNGPKNEIYLQPNQALTFKITTDRVVQVGLKALDKATTYAINNGTEQSLNASTDMFYTVLNKAENETEQTITITNNGTGILSITKLKVCDDPNATLGELTAEDLIPALVSLGYETEPVEAEAVLNITVQAGDQTVTAQLTATGIEGESHTFTAAEIKAAAEAALPEGYTLDGVTFEDVTVVCGAQGETSYTAAAVQNPTPDQPTKVLQKLLAVIKNIFERLFRWL